ncbi:MAG: formyltransferase [Pseudomonadota bacterium]
MNLIVLAYQEIGCVGLEALFEAGAEVRAVLTHQDEAGEKIWFRSVAQTAAAAGIPVYTPTDPNAPEVLALVEKLNPDYVFSFYYRQLLSPEFLALAGRGAYNLHGSLLPQYRGRAPINWVLVNGETETGLTLHRMVKKPDAGPIAAQVKVTISESDTVSDLYLKMIPAAKRLMAETWPRLRDGLIVEVGQDESQATCFGRRRPEDGRIDWRLPAGNIYNLCRAVTHPYPGAFTFYKSRKLFIWSAACDLQPGPAADPGVIIEAAPGEGLTVSTGLGQLVIRSAQWAGEEQINGRELYTRLTPGERFDMS